MQEYQTGGAGGILGIVIAALILIVAFVAGVAVVANKIGDAQSYAIRSDAIERAADKEQERWLEKQAEYRKNEEFRATLPAIEAEAKEDAAFSQSLMTVWQTLTWLAPIALTMIVLPASATVGIGLAIAAPILIIAFVLAHKKKMILRAGLIPLDKETRLFPIITKQVNGLLCIHNPNTGDITIINGNRQEPRPHQITTSGYIQAAGVLGRYAHKANPGNAGAVADVNPPLIVDNVDE